MYWNGQKCIKCESPGTFDSSKKECKCQNNTIYNNQQMKCVQKKQQINIPNLSAKNWVYGNYSVDQYSTKLSQLSKIKTVKRCPLQKPYVNKNGQCFICDLIYDISNQSCDNCSKFKKFNLEKRQCFPMQPSQIQKIKTQQCQKQQKYWNAQKCIKCDKPGQFSKEQKKCICQAQYYYNTNQELCIKKQSNKKNTNSQTKNTIGAGPIFNNNLEQCPLDKPIFNGSECIECNLPKYYNYDNNTCNLCQNNTIFDTLLKKCIPIVQKYNSNFQKNKNYAGAAPQINSNLKTCEIGKPYFDGQNCISCQLPSYFNFAKNKCLNCLVGQKFNDIDRTCTPKFESNINQLKNPNYLGTPPISSSQQKLKTCPKQKPFYNQNNCVNCQYPSYFNFNSNQCQKCKAQQIFNTSKRICQNKVIIPQKYNSYLVNTSNFQGTIPKFDQSLSTCPSAQPYFNGSACISCVLPQYFDLETNKCTTCQSQKIFNSINRLCEYTNPKFMTDLNTINIYYNGDFSIITQTIELRKKLYPGIETCPPEKPFYNPTIGQCMNCPESNPLFDIKYNRCISCRGGSYFNEQKHICSSQGVVSPTIERMMMNAFSWI